MRDIVLITGGLGYLGGRVSRHLSESSPFNLRVGVRGSGIPKPEWLQDGNLAPVDLLDDVSLEAACEGVRAIVHFAALNEIDSAVNPAHALEVNGIGSLKLLKAAVKAGVRRFIYFSTAHVYGSPLAGTLTEATIPRPQHPYAITHRTAEDFVLAARDKKEIEGVVIRLSNAFGVPERHSVNRWTLLTNDLCRQAVVDKKMVLHSSGLQFRDFITIKDVGRAVLHLLMLSSRECADGLFNLGGETPMRVIEMAERIAERGEAILGFKPEVSRLPSDSGEEVHSLDYRIDKLKATGFHLSSDIDEEIEATLKLCDQCFGRRR